MEQLLLQLFNGLSLGSIMLLIALGLAITFGLMNVINMAHGELIMIGAYTTYVVQMIFTTYLPSYFSYYFIFAIPISFLVSGMIGFLIEKGLIQYLYHRPLDSLLATWGVGLILQQSARMIFGAPNVAVKTPDWLDGGWKVMGMTFPFTRIFILILALLAVLLLYLYMEKTTMGRRMRAVTHNRQMAACLGISVRKVDALAFTIGSGLAGIAGCALTTIGPIGPTIGTYYIVDAFMVVILGGFGSILGAVLGALGVGMSSTLIEFTTSATTAKVLVFLLIILFLQWRPLGMIPTKTRALD